MKNVIEYMSNKKGSEGQIYVYKTPVIVKMSPLTISVSSAAKRIKKLTPHQFFVGLKKIVITDLMSFYEDAPFNAFYSNNVIYVSYKLDSEEDFVDDVIHELAHHIEKHYNKIIYENGELQKEFKRKREKLFVELKSYGLQPPLELKSSLKYDKKIDTYLHTEIGYEKLFNFTNGLFLTPYSVTSLKEYFAIGFEKYFLKPEYETRRYIKKVSPALYKKIKILEEISNEG
jgi:hypothetical protein